jgi:hypothetical protein
MRADFQKIRRQSDRLIFALRFPIFSQYRNEIQKKRSMCRIKCKNNKVTPFVSSRSRSPGGSKKGIGKFGCPLTALPLEPSPLEPGQQTPTLLNTVNKLQLLKFSKSLS